MIVRVLNEQQQRNVRTALRFLRLRVGGWAPLAAGLGSSPNTLERVANGRGRRPTVSLALRIALLVEVSFDELVNGHWLSPRVCPHCGHPPDDFVDEQTTVDPKAR